MNPSIQDASTIVKIETNLGDIIAELYPEITPKAVENFLRLSKDQYYDNTNFHRVVEDFIIQGGDPTLTGMGGNSIWTEEFAPEISEQLYHINGALCMARLDGDVTEKTQGSQFYIVSNDIDQTETIKKHEQLKKALPYLLTESDYPPEILEEYKKGGVPYLDTQYTVFGQVIEGMDIVKEISKVETDLDGLPKEKVTINSIRPK